MKTLIPDRMMKTRNLILIAALVFWGCDVQALEDAVDNLDVIVQLEPINTVFSLTVIDAGTLEPIRNVSVSFSGDAAGSLIDAYSDPLGGSELSSGSISFGVNNAVVPSESVPVFFRITGSTAGYFTSFEDVFAGTDGTHSITLRLQKDNPTQPVAGTAVASATVGTTQAGATTEEIVVQTPPPPPPPATAQPTQTAQAQATVTVAAGTVPLAAGGQPLQGTITTNIRVYDTVAGLSALPAAARTSTDGTNQIVSGATLFRMSDGSNQVAVTFRASSSKSSLACGAEFSITLVDPTTVALASLIPASAYSISAFTPADGNTVVLGVTPTVTATGTSLVVTVCLTGISGIGDASQGIILLVTIGGVTFEAGALNAQLTISNPNAFAVNVAGTISGFGVSLATNFMVGPGSTTSPISAWFGDGGNYPFVSGASGGTAFALLDDAQSATTPIANLLMGSGTLTLPTVGLQAFTITATAACPTGQVFEVKPTSSSLDALVVKYRPASGGIWNNVPDPTYDVQDASITATGTLSLLPSTAYEFQGQFADESPQTVTVTTPGLGTTSLTISIDPDDYGFECKTP